MRLLLASNSGRPWLAHCRAEVLDFLGTARRLAFVTAAALRDEDAYHELARDALDPPLLVEHLRWDHDFAPVLARAEAVFVGGGNTYALLGRLRRSGLLAGIRHRVAAGLPYLGASAGANLAGLDILATNDWNVVGLDAFDALGLVPFAINPHYRETDPSMAPGSETRDERIAEYLIARDHPVVALEEGTLLRVEGEHTTVRGTGRVKVFRRGAAPRWLVAGERLMLDP